VDGTPTTAQYTQAIKDAVADFSRRCGLTKVGSISVVAGDATYDLPADFMKLVSMDALVGSGGVIMSAQGLIPVPMEWEETWTISNKDITFYPTPTYALTRYFKYKAAWILTGSSGSETFADLGDNEKDIVLLKAKGISYEKLSNSISSNGVMKYSFGAVSEDLSGNVESYQKRIYASHGEYVGACDDYNGSSLFAGGQ
jgi:hypothetical protein